MNTFTEIFTLFKSYFGNALSRVLSLFLQSDVDLESGLKVPEPPIQVLSEPIPDEGPFPTYTTSTVLDAAYVLGAALAFSPPLPPLPAIFHDPGHAARGRPHNGYHPKAALRVILRRAPLSSITNFTRPTVSKVQLGGTKSPVVRGPYGKGARTVSGVPRLPLPATILQAPTLDSSVPSLRHAATPLQHAKRPLLLDRRDGMRRRPSSSTKRACGPSTSRKEESASKRHSVPLPAKSTAVASRKRHSAPAVLAPNAWRLSLADTFDALALEAQETLAALDEEARIDTEKVQSKAKIMKPLEEDESVFIIGEDEDDEDEADAPPHALQVEASCPCSPIGCLRCRHCSSHPPVGPTHLIHLGLWIPHRPRQRELSLPRRHSCVLRHPYGKCAVAARLGPLRCGDGTLPCVGNSNLQVIKFRHVVCKTSTSKYPSESISQTIFKKKTIHEKIPQSDDSFQEENPK
ncbi:hypothetical protein C8J57DRAFT_1226762 [Mycena rebaudengoi]|nr:hypothetical protein C8J57DRAFT_1226762 [Mycena rebaudengoi]